MLYVKNYHETLIIIFQIKMFRKHQNRNGITSTSSEDEDFGKMTEKNNSDHPESLLRVHCPGQRSYC